MKAAGRAASDTRTRTRRLNHDERGYCGENDDDEETTEAPPQGTPYKGSGASSPTRTGTRTTTWSLRTGHTLMSSERAAAAPKTLWARRRQWGPAPQRGPRSSGRTHDETRGEVQREEELHLQSFSSSKGIPPSCA